MNVKRVLGILLSLVLVFGLMPEMGITAYAAENLTLIADTSNNGTGWSWDGSTLTLNGATLGSVEITPNATIEINGDNTITGETGECG